MNAVQRARLAQVRRVQAQPLDTVLIDAEGELYTVGDTVRVTSVRSTVIFRTFALGTVTHIVDGLALVTFDDGYIATMHDGYEVRLVTGFDDGYGLLTGRWAVRAVRMRSGQIIAWHASRIRRSPAPAIGHSTERVFHLGERTRALDYARAQARANLR